MLRIQKKLSYYLELNWDELPKLTISPEDSPTVVEVAPILDGKPNYSRISEIDLDRLAEDNRLQKSMLQASVRLHEQLKSNWPGDASHHVSQIMDILQTFLESEKLDIKVPDFDGSEKLKTILISLNLQKITNHISQFIRRSSHEKPIIIVDQSRPSRSTETAPIWYTSKPCQPVKKSHISHIVIDSGWEKIGFEFERDRIPGLISWVKNDHLGFEVFYMWQGKQHVYYPDFILRFEDDHYIVIEVKGQEKDQDKEKWLAMNEWTDGVNAEGRYGVWAFYVLHQPSDLWDIFKKE